MRRKVGRNDANTVAIAVLSNKEVLQIRYAGFSFIVTP